jgi:hypothetical protein
MLIDLTLEGCANEVKDIQESMRGLEFSRLADTAAWVHASWTLAQAQGALRRAQCAPGAGGCELEAAASAARSARLALRSLESLSPKSRTPGLAGPGDKSAYAEATPEAYAGASIAGVRDRVIRGD